MNAQQMEMADYDDFAWFYDRHWSAHYHPWAMDVLDRTLLDSVAPASRILDVCCGNGILARELSRRGYAVTGLDSSRRMLSYAKINAPLAEFVCADARTFDTGQIYEGAMSTFDSLNHILASADLRNVFQNVRKSLAPGAPFVFDMNLEGAFTVAWKNTCTTVDEEHACFIRGSYDGNSRIAETAVTIFRSDGGWKRTDFTLRQRFYDPEEVLGLLLAAGFQDGRCLDAATDLGVAGPFAEGRGVFIARAPATDRTAKPALSFEELNARASPAGHSAV